MKKFIVVTGGAGFVGTNLIKFLLKKTNYKIISIDNYSTGKKQNEIERFIKEIHKYDTPIIVEIKTGEPNQDYLDWFLNE